MYIYILYIYRNYTDHRESVSSINNTKEIVGDDLLIIVICTFDDYRSIAIVL